MDSGPLPRFSVNIIRQKLNRKSPSHYHKLEFFQGGLIWMKED
ncbi:hypothetical protein [Schnuerera sp.]|nr:hypothetical protein [Schnuerera sp.]HSH36315.1 hypothetical protein [Schnuerera sp.]